MIRKDGHTDVASAKRQCANIIEDCQDILKALPGDDEASLPTWWTNKLAVSAAYINSDRDYLVYTMAQAEPSQEENNEMMPPTAMMVMNGETDAVEKRQESENDIEEHQGIDEETLEVTIEGDIYDGEETGNIKS
jgi:urease alpha subunit